MSADNAAPVSALQNEKKKLYNRIKITIQMRDKMLGGIPASGDMLDYFLKQKFSSDAAREEFKQRIKDGKLSESEKEQLHETSSCIFEKDREGYCVLWGNNVKAMMREVFTTTGVFIEKMRPKGAAAGGKQTYQHGMFVKGDTNSGTAIRILSKASGRYEPAKQADGTVERVKHIKDQAGERSAIGKHEYFDQPRLSFEIFWVATGTYTIADMRRAWALAEDDGLGASRSQGFGTFTVIGWEVLEEPAVINPPKTKKVKTEAESEEENAEA